MSPAPEREEDPLAFDFFIYRNPESPYVLDVNCVPDTDYDTEQGEVDPHFQCMWLDNWRSYKVRLPTEDWQTLVHKREFPKGFLNLNERKQQLVSTQMIEGARLIIESMMRLRVAAMLAHPRVLNVAIAMPGNPEIDVLQTKKKFEVVARSKITLISTRVAENAVAYEAIDKDDQIEIA